MEQQDKKISQMTQLTNISGDESVPVVRSGGNYRVLVNQIVALARQTMVAAETGKGLSANDFTNTLKAKLEGLSNYDDTQVRALIAAVSGRLDTILGDGASSAIDTFNEIEAFLTGITDTQTLTGLLQQQKQTITSETDTKLAGKVDKVAGKGLSANDYTDDEKAKLTALPTNEQFGIVGWVSKLNGQFKVESGYRSSELLPLNHNYDLVFVAKAILKVASVSFYTASGTWISSVQKTTTAESTIPKSEFPANAVFVRFTAVAAEISSCYYKNGPTLEAREGAMAEAIQAAKLALFIEEFNAAAGANGKYDPVNALDPQHTFYLNTLWLTYEEAVVSMAHINEIYLRGGASMSGLKIRTNMLAAKPVPTNWGPGFVYLNGVCLCNSSIEVLNVRDIVVDGSNNLGLFVYNCPNLHTIIGQIALEYVTKISTNTFNKSPKLQEVRLYNLKASINFKDCPLLSLATLQYLVDNAANKSAITVTVHPVTYGKLTNEQADIMEMMPENLTGEFLTRSPGATAIENGVEIATPGSYFSISGTPRLVNSNVGKMTVSCVGKMTVSCDVEGLQDGESIALFVGSSAERPRPTWTISANGRAVFSFNCDKYFRLENNRSLLLYDGNNTYTGQGLKLTNFKLAYGEHDALPYTPPLSAITDAGLREQAEWASLMQIAEARQINFVTTE